MTCVPSPASPQPATRAQGCELSAAGLLGSQLPFQRCRRWPPPNPSGRMSTSPPFMLPTPAQPGATPAHAGGFPDSVSGLLASPCGRWSVCRELVCRQEPQQEHGPRLGVHAGGHWAHAGQVYGDSGHRHGCDSLQSQATSWGEARSPLASTALLAGGLPPSHWPPGQCAVAVWSPAGGGANSVAWQSVSPGGKATCHIVPGS